MNDKLFQEGQEMYRYAAVKAVVRLAILLEGDSIPNHYKESCLEIVSEYNEGMDMVRQATQTKTFSKEAMDDLEACLNLKPDPAPAYL